MYICCAFVGAIKDSVSQNAPCNSEKKCNYRIRLDLVFKLSQPPI